MQSRDKVTYTDEEIKKVWDDFQPELKKMKPRWELQRSDNKEFIFEVAKGMGWLETPQTVQVRRIAEARIDGSTKDYYAIEPYEEDCTCPDIVPPPTDTVG